MRKIEFSTKDEWLEYRKNCLTGTTIANYIGIKSPYIQKTQEQMDKDPAVNFGKNCETSILTIFKNLPEIAKRTLVYPTLLHTIWVSDEDNRIAGSFDALAFEDNKNGFVECKSTSAELYDLRNMIIPEATWVQIMQYFTVDDSLDFCYLVVCDYPKWGNRSVKIDWVRISRNDIIDRINNIKLWQKYILKTWR